MTDSATPETVDRPERATICKYCDEPRNEYAILRHTGRPAHALPKGTAWVCDECADRGQDWFEDSDMEDRS